MVQFAGSEAHVEVVFVRGVRLLNGAPRGSVEPGHGQAQRSGTGHGKFFLNQPLPEGASSDHQSAVVVLHGARKNFTGRRRPLVDKHGHGPVHVGASTAGFVGAAGRGFAFGVNNGLALVQEQLHHVDHGVEVPTAIASQVHHHRCRALGGEKGHGLFKFLGGAGGKANGLQVAYRVFHGEGGHHALNGDAVSG